MAKNKTIVSFILDKSGSMGSVREATISGFNEYVGTLKRDGKSHYEFTLTLFDTEVTMPVKGASIKKVPDLVASEYVPDGMTALYDAVCRTIKKVKAYKGDKVLCVIMTDGQENSSKEYTQDTMKALIKEKEKEGNWTFVFLGANQDSYANAQQFGMKTMNVSNYNATPDGIKKAMRSVASNTVAYAASAGLSTQEFFTRDDQESLEAK